MSENSPYIQSRIGAGSYFEVTDDENSGSSSNAANQQFDISLAGITGVIIGQKAAVSACEFRGDFSGTNEYVDVGFGLSTNPKTSVGIIGADSSVYAVDNSLVGVTFDIIDIGGGVPGIRIFVSPTVDVNFSPGGMPNGWWWQLKLSFQAVSY